MSETRYKGVAPDSYQSGYDDGYQAGRLDGGNDGFAKGERRGWEKGKEAAAEKIEHLGEAMIGIETKWENYAGANSIKAAVETLVAAIRKLKKP